MRDRNLAGFGWVLEMVMRTGNADDPPTIILKQPNEFPAVAFHARPRVK
jgi:hypothetical protein